ncbi:MAG: hypothetical protein WBP90_11430 [Terracidiphilus sp.]
MNARKQNGSGTRAAALLLLLAAPAWLAAQPTPEASAAFNSYIGRVEARLAAQHRSAGGFLAPVDFARLRQGELIIAQRTTDAGTELPGALLHDWYGTAFIPSGKAADFERVMKNFDAYPKVYSPQVLTAKVTEHDGDHFQATMRVQQKHMLTVVMDTAYDITFGRLDAEHGYSISRSTQIAEIGAPGTTHERVLGPGEEHGFLWRMNTYWSYEERDGGLYIQIESVSLSRSIPIGLGWAIGPFIESVPRDSLEFTLRATSNALRKQH